MLELTREQARRTVLRAQLLDLPRPTDLLEVVRRLTLLHVDLTAHVAPSAELVLWSRLGSAGLRRGDLGRARDDGSLVELTNMLRPVEDVRWHRPEMRRAPRTAGEEHVAGWLRDNRAAAEEVLEALRADGPLPARALPDSCVRPWRSSGWSSGRSTLRLLEVLERRGEVAVAHRDGRERCWDLAARVLADDPDDAPDPEEARVERARRRLASLGVDRAPDVGERVRVEGTRGTWSIDAEQLERLDEPFEGRCALLSPLDRTVFDRRRALELLDLDYQLEMYKPVGRRRWGYWALPVLHGDRFVAKLDVEADHAGGVLRWHALHEDVPLGVTERDDVAREVVDLARYLDLVLVDEREVSS